MENQRYEMRFSGTGGQGLMILGDIMARTVGCVEGKEIILTKSYGPESRGGASRSELIVDTVEINYPVLTEVDFMLAMSQAACDRYCRDVKKDGILLADLDLVKNVPPFIENVYRIPLTRISERMIGKKNSANIAALGAAAVLTRIAEVENLKRVLEEYFPGEAGKSNIAVFEQGIIAAKQAIIEKLGLDIA